MVVHLAEDVSQPNGVWRQEKSPLTEFGVKTYSFNINAINYDTAVEQQISQQQALVMQVQTAIANARKSEQDALTAAKQGEADAAKAEWAQKVVKATEVGAAEKNKEVAKVQWEQAILVAEQKVNQADLYKKEQKLLGEGDAARRAAALAADGALELKINAYKEVNHNWAVEIGKQKWVPDVMIGGNGSGGDGGNQALGLMQMLMLKTAKDLQLDTGIHAKWVPSGEGVPVPPPKGILGMEEPMPLNPEQRKDAFRIYVLIGERDMPSNCTAERLVARSGFSEDRVLAALELLWAEDTGFVRVDENRRTGERGYFVDPKCRKKTPTDLDDLFEKQHAPLTGTGDEDDDEDEDDEDDEWKETEEEDDD